MPETVEELRARVAELEKQNGEIRFAVGTKGGVSVYGLGRFPVTLYFEQWKKLLDVAPELGAFLEDSKAAGKLKLLAK